MSLESGHKKTILIATGASGGHVFPALAVAEKLVKMNVECVFVGNDSKYLNIVEEQGFKVLRLPASPWNVKNPIKRFKALLCLLKAFAKSLNIIHTYKASAVFGTGGYATVALMLASKFTGVPTLVAEQNVLPGRANRFLAKWVDRVCLTFESSRHYLKFRDGVMVTVGNPIRESIVEQSKAQRECMEKKTLMIMGGSQGAKILSDVVPSAIELLPYELKRNINIIQQTRPEDEKRVLAEYHRIDVPAQVKAFYDNMPEVLNKTDLMIARSGASTICEAALFGIPAIYVPLRLADGHQILNARAMEGSGAAIMIEQNEFTPEKLASELTDLLKDETHMKQMSKAACEAAKPNAAQDIANEVMKLSEQDVMQMLGEIEGEDK